LKVLVLIETPCDDIKSIARNIVFVLKNSAVKSSCTDLQVPAGSGTRI